MSRLRPREWPEDPARRTSYVDSIFRTIAPRYDLLTRLLSMGQDRRWKANVLRHVPPGDDASRHLDLATGTAALPVLFRKAWYRGTIIGLDRSRAMLREARRRGGLERVRFVEGDLDFLPFREGSFDIVTMAYGLRYLTEIRASLEEVYRLLRPGGVFVCLDFGLPGSVWYRKLCFAYLLALGTAWGLLLHGRPGTYWHIVESLRAYPGQHAVGRLMKDVGFADIVVEEQWGGISAIIRGGR